MQWHFLQRLVHPWILVSVEVLKPIPWTHWGTTAQKWLCYKVEENESGPKTRQWEALTPGVIRDRDEDGKDSVVTFPSQGRPMAFLLCQDAASWWHWWAVEAKELAS
jgi:hypothetical protein